MGLLEVIPDIMSSSRVIDRLTLLFYYITVSLFIMLKSRSSLYLLILYLRVQHPESEHNFKCFIPPVSTIISLTASRCFKIIDC